MERKIGDTFVYEGKKLIVEESNSGSCVGCFFNEQCPLIVRKTAGKCQAESRADNKHVIFVEVKKQSQKETKAVKELKIGETFEYKGKRLKAIETEDVDDCAGCVFFKEDCKQIHSIVGECEGKKRNDGKGVVFVDADEFDECPILEEEAPQEQTESQQQLNLCELLRHCPKGIDFWSPMLGDVKLNSIDHAQQRVFVTLETGANWYFNSDATLSFNHVTSADIMLYPSREQKDWSKVKYELKNVLPRTWEEFCENYPCKKDECCITAGCGLYWAREGDERQVHCDKNFLSNKQAAEAHLAFMQLHQLRDAWREGWLPNWTDNSQAKFAIVYNKYEYIVFDCRFISRFLTFQDESRAKEFLECFKDLIEKAGDLI